MESFDVELIQEYRHPLSLHYKSYDLASELAGISTGRQEGSDGLRVRGASRASSKERQVFWCVMV